MSRNGLLAREHLDVIFLNLEELISINEHLLTQLNNAVSAAVDAGDEVSSVSPQAQRPLQQRVCVVSGANCATATCSLQCT